MNKVLLSLVLASNFAISSCAETRNNDGAFERCVQKWLTPHIISTFTEIEKQYEKNPKDITLSFAIFAKIKTLEKDLEACRAHLQSSTYRKEIIITPTISITLSKNGSPQ